MKKNIFYTMQGVKAVFYTLVDSCKTIALKMFRENTVLNKLLYYSVFLFMSLFFSANSYGQLVDPGAIRANFGVDGDAYANFQGFSIVTPPGSTTPPSVTAGVDDWFVNKTPPPDSLGVRSPYWNGSGLNVIDQRDGAALKATIQGNNNYSFTKRQSRPPLSIVVSSVNGVPTPYLWIDAVYGRDNNSAQSNTDASIFTATADKNPDNPSTYLVGTGSVPQKDDIIDVMAHLRGEGPKDPTAQDPRPFTTLYAYGAATLRSTSGSKHIDFEFFRTLAEVSGTSFINTGSDGGRTAFTFNPDGSLNKPGTIIVSIDYEGGGTKPDVRIRVWMSKASFDALSLNPSARPFNVVAGSFEQGLLSGDFGYARITALSDAVAAIWGRVNAEGSTLAAPWGTLEGSTATLFDEYQTLQHVEIGINLTAFNLDRKDDSDPCSNILGSLLVKTRSCAGGNNDPFTCELKDYAGPYAFGFTVKPEVSLSVDRTITCTNTTATITATGVKPNGAPVVFYGPASSENGGLGPIIPAEDAAPDLNRTVSVGGVYAAVVSAPGFAGCMATAYITVQEDKAPPIANDSHTNVSCNGGTDGSVTITFGGGTGPYEVNFNGAGYVSQISPKVYSGLAAGTYSWIVRGANGCTASGSETITQPAALIASDAHTNVSCNGGTNGTVTVTFSGGTAPYTVNFNGGGFVTQTSPKAYTGLAAGTYSWVVRDANGCEQSGSETVTQPTALIASDAHANVTCNGGTDGSVTVTFSGGTAPYSVNFNGGGFVAQISPKAYTGLAAGTYSWVVRDANGCEQSGSETVTQPTALIASDAHTNVSCNGGTDGSVTVTFSGGTAPYTVNFNGGGFVAQTSPKAYTGLAAGTYSWVVRDANGCEQSGSETVTQPTALIASDAHTNVSCNGGTDGSVTVTFSGGTAPYTVNFNGGGFVAQTSPKAYTGLAAGTYSWVVRDANGCEQSGSETVTQPTALIASDAHTNVSCNGGTNGTVTVTFSGGTAPYSVNFNGGGFVAQTSPKAYTGLAAGTYSWVVRDANGCEQSGSETVTQPTALIASDAHTDASCNGGTDGSVTITFSGGTAPYMVNFNGGGFVSQTSPKVYSGLTTGTYSWVVRDANGCEQSGSEIVGQPSTIVASDAHTNVSCNGGTNGTVTVTFSGGTAPYSVNFNGGGFVAQTSPKAYTGLGAGTYSWVVRDANGCEQSGSETVTQPTALIASDAHTNVACNGGTDGTVTVTFSGGTAPYSVNFNGGGFVAQTSPKAYTGLGAGTYSWVVRDANGCEQSGSETVTQPTALIASDAHTNVSCNGGTNGTVTVTFSGGTAPYSVNFNGGGFVAQTSPKAYTGLGAGTYSWVVRDANGCEQFGSETVTQPTALIASDAHTNVACNGGTDGSVTVTFSGGTAPYTVNFNGGGFVAQTSPKAYTGLAAGTYSWVVRDANGCEQSGSETVTQPTALIASDAHTNVACNGGTDGSVTVTFSGGTAPYSVNFNGGGFVSQTSPKVYTGLSAGTYSWVVKDANGCEQSGSETVTQPTALIASDAHTNVSCNGGTDGSVTVTFSGGTAPYTVNFNGGGFVAQTSPKAYAGLGAGTYSWVVRDANGCEQSGSETVTQPTALIASDAHINVTCNGGTDGSVTITFSGGTAPYFVNFNGGGFVAQTSPKAYTGLGAGTYSWVVRDANGCEQSGSEMVAQPTALIASDVHTEVTCLGFSDGSLTITFSGGTAPYMVNFNGGGFMAETSPKVYTGLGAGTYSWVVKDANGCEQSGSETLSDGPSCGGELCTYTQGAYGNSGGLYCDGTTGGISTANLITQAITNAGGTIAVGKAGVSSVYMNSGDASCIITQMPGGGKATEIVPAGDYPICPSLPNSFLKNGKINNVLLSQTIALSLNVNITKPSQLGSFILQAGTLATAKPEGGCGSSVAKQRICGHLENNIWIPTVNEYTYRTFSAAVINAIIPDGNGNRTVAGLLDLANRALANADTVKNTEGGVSLTDIAGAVAAVNEVFDECAIAVGWDVEKCPAAPALDLATVTAAKVSTTETAGFDAYPVPFKDQLTIKYNFDYVSDVTIEVFNSKGVLVYSMIDTASYLGKEVTIFINTPLEQQQVYYVRLTTSQGSTVKSVMSSY